MKCAKCKRNASSLRRVAQQDFMACPECRPGWDVSALRGEVKSLQSQLAQAQAELERERTRIRKLYEAFRVRAEVLEASGLLPASQEHSGFANTLVMNFAHLFPEIEWARKFEDEATEQEGSGGE